MEIVYSIMITMGIISLYNIIDGMWVVGLGQSTIEGFGLVTLLWIIINDVGTGLGNSVISSIIINSNKNFISIPSLHS